MPSLPEVELFLKQLKEKLQFNAVGVVYRPRKENMETLALLDIVPAMRDEIIVALTAENYMSGPKNDTYDPTRPHYYEFGIIIKGIEVYIKISIGLPNKAIDCMSFHKVAYPIKYPLKKQQNER